MKIISDRPGASPVFLPTEIVIQIVSSIATLKDVGIRQQTLYSCCLVSRQWYSAAVPFLYESPRLEKGKSFERFTAIVCPPLRAAKGKTNLGSFVRRLDMGMLVHHSSNSLTGRLLGRVKENLEEFYAPAASFSVTSLTSLSKCHNLQTLDLSLVNSSIPWNNLKKTISHLEKLVTLRLPRFSTFSATTETDHLPWPPKLYRLQVSGKFYDEHVPFLWPEQITRLALDNCSDLSFTAMSRLLTNPRLTTTTLRCLSISTFNRGLQIECIQLALISFPNLVFLSFPGNMVTDDFFRLLPPGPHTKPLALEVLALGSSQDQSKLQIYFWDSLIAASRGPLANLRAVCIHYMFHDHYWESLYDWQRELESELCAHFRSRELPVSKETKNFRPGVYDTNVETPWI